MHFKITTENMEAMYAFLLVTKPFCDLNLPFPESVGFTVTNEVKRLGYAVSGGSPGAGMSHTIAVSQRNAKHSVSLMMTMAHEMLHVHLDRKGVKSHHGAEFKRLAGQVCRHHGFDPGRF